MITTSSEITVLTSITGGKDYLTEKQPKGTFVAYLDVPRISKTWEVRKAPQIFLEPRRNSRIPKILSHLFCETEYSIWIDGNVTLLKKPEELVKRYLMDNDIALFKHPKRDCIYDEAIRCATGKLDDPEVIIEQVSRYEREGYAKHKGLYECGVIIRRHTPKVIEFNNYWWAEYCRGSVRDQISCAYCADKVGLRIKVLDAPWYLDENGIDVRRSDFVKQVPHTILNPQLHV
jgi:hypothetical protein